MDRVVRKRSSISDEIRDKLIPALEDFNPNLVSNLVEMSNRYKEIYSIFNELIIKYYGRSKIIFGKFF